MNIYKFHVENVSMCWLLNRTSRNNLWRYTRGI